MKLQNFDMKERFLNENTIELKREFFSHYVDNFEKLDDRVL